MDQFALLRKMFPKARTSGLRTRLDILNAFIDCAYQDGLETITFESIGNRAGVTKANVHHYFGSISEILRSAVSFVAQSAQQHNETALASIDDPRDKFRTWVKITLEWAEKSPRELAMYGLAIYCQSKRETKERFWNQITEVGAQRIALFIRELVDPKVAETEIKKAADDVEAFVVGKLLLHGTDAKTSQHAPEIEQFFNNRIASLILVTKS